MCNCSCKEVTVSTQTDFYRLVNAITSSKVKQVSSIAGDEYILFADGIRVAIKGRSSQCS